MNSDDIKGTIDDAAGRAKRQVGEWTGNEKAQAEGENDKIEEEIGDILFALLNLARKLEVDAETALKRTNRKFRRRFAYIEKSLKAENTVLESAGLKKLDELWNEAKSRENS